MLPHRRRLLLFLLLNLLDLLLTWRLLQPGAVSEGNPVANWWLLSYGWPGLIGFKAAMVLLSAGLLTVVARRRPLAGSRALNVACVAVGAVVLYSACLLGRHHESIAALRQARQQEAEADRKGARLREFAAFQKRLDADLLSRRCSLGEAVARLAHTEQARDRAWRVTVRQSCPCPSEEECLAAYVLRHAVMSKSDDPAAARRAARRLKAEYRTTFGAPPPSCVCNVLDSLADG